jgi:hypothetical protein
MLVKDREDANTIAEDQKEHRVRKHTHERAPNALRELDDPLGCTARKRAWSSVRTSDQGRAGVSGSRAAGSRSFRIAS